MLLAEETWISPTFWTGVVREFGVPILVILALGLFIGCVMLAVYLVCRKVYSDYSPMVKGKMIELADGHKNFMDTAAASIDIHAKANASHAAAHVVSAESLKAISEAVEDGHTEHRDRLSDLIRIVHGGLTAVGEGLEELEEIHKDNPPMLKAIGRFRVRLASMRAQDRRKKLSDSDS